jgi:hypothetical protein
MGASIATEEQPVVSPFLQTVTSHRWTKPQPSGIRVTDAIDWARSIYDRYVGTGTPPTVLTVSPEHPWVFMKLPDQAIDSLESRVSTG